MRQRLGVVQRGLYPTQTVLSGDFTVTIYLRSAYLRPGTGLPAVRREYRSRQIASTVSQNFFPYIPVVNGPTVQGNNLTGTPVQKIDDNQDTIRVDWIISPKNSLFGRQTWQNSPLTPASLVPFGGTLVTSGGTNEVAQLTTTTSTTVNVFRLYHSYAQLFGEQVTVTPISLRLSASPVCPPRRRIGAFRVSVGKGTAESAATA